MDNDPNNADAIKELLDFEDLHTVAIYDIEVLSEKILEFAPDLLIMSIPLRNRDGSALCVTLKNSPDHNHIKIILISTQYNILKDEKLVGCFDGFLEKPFDIQELIEMVETCLLQEFPE